MVPGFFDFVLLYPAISQTKEVEWLSELGLNGLFALITYTLYRVAKKLYDDKESKNAYIIAEKDKIISEKNKQIQYERSEKEKAQKRLEGELKETYKLLEDTHVFLEKFSNL